MYNDLESRVTALILNISAILKQFSNIFKLARLLYKIALSKMPIIPEYVLQSIIPKITLANRCHPN